MATCVPIKDMRDTAAFAELVETSATPITVTRNGYDQFVVMRTNQYEALLAMQEKNRLYERMLLADFDMQCGKPSCGAGIIHSAILLKALL